MLCVVLPVELADPKLFSFPICTAIGLQWIARYCKQYFPDFSAHLSFCQDSVDRLINQDDRQHICDMTSWTDRILFHVVCVCVFVGVVGCRDGDC